MGTLSSVSSSEKNWHNNICQLLRMIERVRWGTNHEKSPGSANTGQKVKNQFGEIYTVSNCQDRIATPSASYILLPLRFLDSSLCTFSLLPLHMMLFPWLIAPAEFWTQSPKRSATQFSMRDEVFPSESHENEQSMVYTTFQGRKQTVLLLERSLKSFSCLSECSNWDWLATVLTNSRESLS